MPIDVLMLQLGTPTEPTAKGLRPYLRQFLSDPRVIEAPAIVRWMLVNLIIVPFRSPKSAEKYKRIWDDKTGSPLLSITRSQQQALAEKLGPDYRVSFAMRYGEPSVAKVVDELMKKKSQRMIILPMFPQYSATTTASGLDAIFQTLQKYRVVPALRVIRDYHDDPDYLDAITNMIKHHRDKAIADGKQPEMYLISFHGIPINYIKRGDPYMRQSAITGKAIAKRMGWKKGDWKLVFQSRLGGQKWLTPYTDETLKSLGRQGVKRVLVAQPGFTADCLETIDEIGYEGQEEFEETGGEELIRVPCANDDPGFIEALANIVRRESFGWI
ncbi:ferrochelatase [bacterium]|nr:ferrochelatase [bacterium]